MDNELLFNEAIIEEREHGIQEIQQQIGEVNEIFKDLAVLVSDQGVMIGKNLTASLYFNCSSFMALLLNHAINLTIFQMILVPTLKVPMLQQHKELLNFSKLQRLKNLVLHW